MVSWGMFFYNTISPAGYSTIINLDNFNLHLVFCIKHVSIRRRRYSIVENISSQMFIPRSGLTIYNSTKFS